MNNPQNKWLFYYQPNRQAAVRLFCFPYSGAGASLFLPWRSILPKSIDLVPVQLPGRENRIGERPYTQLAPLVAAVAEAIRPFLDKPFAFF
ncbi:MAG: thioesterase II family protein, partial [Anaerolineae bacterium]